jgi:glycerol-3-phosphate cytidylyltransferase
MKKVVTFGTFDLLHVGHIRMLRRAKELGDYLAVGVSSDELNIIKKGHPSVYGLQDRLEIVAALECVDEVFVEHSLEHKADYCKGFNLFVIGDDWKGQFDHIKTETLEVRYLPRTPDISTTETIAKVRDI